MNIDLSNKMLEAVSLSRNPITSEFARRNLDGELSRDDAERYAGGFMRAVLDGNFPSAVMRADYENLEALRAVFGPEEIAKNLPKESKNGKAVNLAE